MIEFDNAYNMNIHTFMCFVASWKRQLALNLKPHHVEVCPHQTLVQIYSHKPISNNASERLISKNDIGPIYKARVSKN